MPPTAFRRATIPTSGTWPTIPDSLNCFTPKRRPNPADNVGFIHLGLHSAAFLYCDFATEKSRITRSRNHQIRCWAFIKIARCHLPASQSAEDRCWSGVSLPVHEVP